MATTPDRFLVYLVRFRDELVECVARQDAIAIQAAHRIASGHTDGKETPEFLHGLAQVLERYRLFDDAKRFRGMAMGEEPPAEAVAPMPLDQRPKSHSISGEAYTAQSRGVAHPVGRDSR